MAIEFDPYKRPPAARLLAILVVSVLVGWLMASGARESLTRIARDPEKYLAASRSIVRHGFAFHLVFSLLIVTTIVFVVDALTSVFGRWLKEREVTPPPLPPLPPSSPSP